LSGKWASSALNDNILQLSTVCEPQIDTLIHAASAWARAFQPETNVTPEFDFHVVTAVHCAVHVGGSSTVAP